MRGKRMERNIGAKSIVALLLVVVVTAEKVWADHPSVGVQGLASGPIITSTAGALGANIVAVSVDFQYVSFDAVSNAALTRGAERGEDIHSTNALSRTALNATYGVSEKLTVGLSLPYIERQGLRRSAHGHGGHDAEEHHEGGGEDIASAAASIIRLGNAEGLGDAQLYGAYQFYAEPGADRAALLFGVKMPTGNTQQKSRVGERLETELQPGSGSWDYFFGLAYSTKYAEWAVDANVMYTLVSEGAQRTRQGDIFNYNIAFSRPLLGLKHDHRDHMHDHGAYACVSELLSAMSLALVMEINGVQRDRVEIAGHVEANSGGNLLYFSPGLRANVGQWAFNTALSIPIENLYGTQSEPETGVHFRASYVF